MYMGMLLVICLVANLCSIASSEGLLTGLFLHRLLGECKGWSPLLHLTSTLLHIYVYIGLQAYSVVDISAILRAVLVKQSNQ